MHWLQRSNLKSARASSATNWLVCWLYVDGGISTYKELPVLPHQRQADERRKRQVQNRKFGVNKNSHDSTRSFITSRVPIRQLVCELGGLQVRITLEHREGFVARNRGKFQN